MNPKSLEKPLLISCGILQREIEALIALEEIKAEAVFLSKYLHVDDRKLYDALKAALHRYRAREPVVVYGDLCLGCNGEMQALMTEYDAVKVDGLNCIDCLLGGRGKLLEMDPGHRLFFLTPASLEFSENLISGAKEDNRRRFNMLKGIILLDSLDDMERHRNRIEHFSDRIGLPVLEHRIVGLYGLKAVVEEALQKRRQSQGCMNSSIDTGREPAGIRSRTLASNNPRIPHSP